MVSRTQGFLSRKIYRLHCTPQTSEVFITVVWGMWAGKAHYDMSSGCYALYFSWSEGV